MTSRPSLLPLFARLLRRLILRSSHPVSRIDRLRTPRGAHLKVATIRSSKTTRCGGAWICGRANSPALGPQARLTGGDR